MGTISINVTPKCDNPPKARLPRKLKKDIIKVAGRDAYKRMINSIQDFYNQFGYRKFSFRRK